MRSRLNAFLTLPLALFAAITFAPSAQAAVQDRLATVSGSLATLQGNVSGRVKHSSDLGAAPQNRKLESLSLRFSLTSAQQADLNQLQAAQLNPSSPSYHKWLTPEQFGARFGLSTGDLAKVSAWLTSQGFQITSTARSSTFITFSGTVGQAQQAFGTSIHNMSFNGEQYIANVSDPVLPASLAGVVSSLTGLNNYKLKPHSRVRNGIIDPAAKPSYTQTINGTTSHYIAPADLYTIYDFPPTTGSTPITGAGITIAVMGQTDIVPGDIAAFRAAAGLPATTVTQKLVPTDSDPGISNGDVDEAHIDLEWSGAAAPGASLLYVFGNPNTAGGVFDALTYTIDNKLAPIVSMSYGLYETGYGTSSLAGFNLLLQQANVEGMTVVASSGDDGATDADVVGEATEGLAVDFPGSSPYATSAGGTMFSGDTTAASFPTYWNTSNATNGGSAQGYIPEQPWNETSSTLGLGDGVTTGGGAGGGGASAFFSKPAWQVGIGVPADASRDVPDFAMNAAANHDGYMICSTGSTDSNGNAELGCVNNSFLTSSGQPNVFGGTSFVAPTFAGILALVEQKLGGAASAGIGNVGPTLYGLATVANVFHDVTTGNNAVLCMQGTPNCPTGAPIGYNAGVGYDQASGWGSIDVANLVNNWSTAVPTSSVGSASSAVVSTTTVTTSSQLCAVNAATLALTVTVASGSTKAGYTGQPISSAVPTGMVQVLVDNVAVGSPEPLVNGVASISLNTATISSGGHTISASYAGDGIFAGSKGSLLAPNTSTGENNALNYPNGAVASVDFVSTTKPDFSITPCAGAVSVAPGATSSGITFTVTPFNGFTGAVNLTFANTGSMLATPTFSVQPVNITTSAGVTTSFVVVASESTTATSKLVPQRSQPSSKTPWYAAGSGATLACMLLLTLPRRRRWGALLAAVLSIAAITAVGCSNTSTTGNTNPTNPNNPTTPASPGTYTFIVTAVSGSLVHSSQVTVTVP